MTEHQPAQQRVPVLYEVVDAVHDDAYPDDAEVEYGQRLKNIIELTLREVVTAPVLVAPERLLRLDERGLRSFTQMPRPLSSREMIKIAEVMRQDRIRVVAYHAPDFLGRFLTIDMLDATGATLPPASDGGEEGLPQTIEVVTVTPPQRTHRAAEDAQSPTQEIIL